MSDPAQPHQNENLLGQPAGQEASSAFASSRKWRWGVSGCAAILLVIVTVLTIRSVWHGPAEISVQAEEIKQANRTPVDPRVVKARLSEELAAAVAETEQVAAEEFARVTEALMSRIESHFIPWMTSYSTGLQLDTLRMASSTENWWQQVRGTDAGEDRRRDVEKVEAAYRELVVEPTYFRARVEGARRRIGEAYAQNVETRLEKVRKELGIAPQQWADTISLNSVGLVSLLKDHSVSDAAVQAVFEGAIDARSADLIELEHLVTQIRLGADTIASLVNGDEWWVEFITRASATALGTNATALKQKVQNKASALAAGAATTMGTLDWGTMWAVVASNPLAVAAAGTAVVTWLATDHLLMKPKAEEALRILFKDQMLTLHAGLIHNQKHGVAPALTSTNQQILAGLSSG